MMPRNVRKCLGLLCAVLLYYLIHEGAHALTALLMGTFQRVRIVKFGLGVQIVADTSAMSDVQIFFFCIAGALATLIAGYVMLLNRGRILTVKSKLLRAAAYYATLFLLMQDPLYLSVIHPFVGGGDMNGIAQLGIPVLPVSAVFLAIGGLHLYWIIRFVYRDYKNAFAQ